MKSAKRARWRGLTSSCLWAQPSCPFLIKPSRCRLNRRSGRTTLRIFYHYIGGHALRKWKGRKRRRVRISRPVFQVGPLPKRPRFVKTVLKEPKHQIVVAGTDDKILVRQHGIGEPHKQSMETGNFSGVMQLGVAVVWA